ncbi:hypothetical protein HK099_004937 [Clydaea vesicula]|uniref:Uncharacterized protein n=1 Tax=Clydaea vesicula TaxID=447962 RepID=A0AAD5U014_9FUNG|nr:hypothetical protein HK099_004937 [Clydaea vesicula]
MSKQQLNKFLDKLMNCYTEEELASYQDGKGAQLKPELTHSGNNKSKEPKLEEFHEEKVKQPDLSVEQRLILLSVRENEMQNDWTKVKVPKYREWLEDYFKVYEAADTYRAILLKSSTKQTQSASQFYAYLFTTAATRFITILRTWHSSLSFPALRSIVQTFYQWPEEKSTILEKRTGMGSYTKFTEWMRAVNRKFVARPQTNAVASSRYPTSEHLKNLGRLTRYDPVFRSGVLSSRHDAAQWLIDNNVCLFHRILLSDCDAAGLAHSRYDFISATALY